MQTLYYFCEPCAVTRLSPFEAEKRGLRLTARTGPPSGSKAACANAARNTKA
jgi:hypothetical protein